jgi:SAM-dependent methyltransferase
MANAAEIITPSKGLILDVAAGYGRNALYLARRGMDVLCLDSDAEALAHIESLNAELGESYQSGRLTTRRIDLEHDVWPFEQNSIESIVLVHYFHPTLFAYCASSLKPGGCLLFETVGAHGGNFLQLPQPGFVRSLLSSTFDLQKCDEKPVASAGHAAATVKLIARKHQAEQSSTTNGPLLSLQ